MGFRGLWRRVLVSYPVLKEGFLPGGAYKSPIPAGREIGCGQPKRRSFEGGGYAQCAIA